MPHVRLRIMFPFTLNYIWLAFVYGLVINYRREEGSTTKKKKEGGGGEKRFSHAEGWGWGVQQF